MNTLKTLTGLACWCVSLPALAGGALTFDTAPTTVNSGDAQSWMNRFGDWDQISPLAGGFVVPNLFGSVGVTTNRTAADLILKFNIPDHTHKKPNDSVLDVGDQVIVEIDTNATRGATLTDGKSFRYQIVIGSGAGNTNKISSARVFTPIVANNWGAATAITFPATGSPCPASYPNGCAALSLNGDDYAVELRVPLAAIGMSNPPANDVGLAILISNDLGNTHAGVSDQTAVTFSFADMPAGTAPFNDPGLVQPATNGMTNIWNMPNHWGTALFSAPSQNPALLTFSQLPAPWLSESIRLSLCDSGRWEDIQPAILGGDQSALAGWYKYERDQPCKMGVWVKATNSSATASVAARILVLWGDAGLNNSNNWRVVGLSPPLSFGPGSSTTRMVWDQVPSMGSVPGGSTHPCMRAYILPASLSAAQIAMINGIHDGPTFTAFEDAFQAQATQMNFTNLANGNCSRPGCTQVVIGRNLELPNELFDMLGVKTAAAQVRGEEGGSEGLERAVPIDPNYKPQFPRVNDPWFGVSVQGFAVPVTMPPLPYVFIESIGGVGWAVPYTMVADAGLTLGFNITNPPLLYRDYTVTPVQNFPAPKRRILLLTEVHAPPGMEVPKFTVAGAADGGLDPSATVPGTISVAQTAGGSTLPYWVRCLLAGNIWCWLIVLIILAIIVLLVRRRSPASP